MEEEQAVAVATNKLHGDTDLAVQNISEKEKKKPQFHKQARQLRLHGTILPHPRKMQGGHEVRR